MIQSPLYVRKVGKRGDRLYADLDPDIGVPLWLRRLKVVQPLNAYQIDVALRCMVLEVRACFGACDVRILPGTKREGRSQWSRRFHPPGRLYRDGTADGAAWYRRFYGIRSNHNLVKVN